MDEEKFRTYLKRGGRSQSAIERCVAYVQDFASFLQHTGKELNEAGPQELESFVDWVECEPKASAKGHLWGLRYFFDFVGNESLCSLARQLRGQRIKRKPFMLRDFRGVDPAHAEKLAVLGIVNVKQMLAAGKRRGGREKLSKEAELPLEVVLELVKLSDLARVSGLKSIRARLYYDAGVDTVDKLAEWEAGNLRVMLTEFVERTGFDGIAPLPKEAESAVAQAKKLPKIVEYE